MLGSILNNPVAQVLSIEAHIFLAKLIGAYMLVMALYWIINRSRMVEIIELLHDNPVALLVSGVTPTVVGLALVLSHNYWTGPYWLVLVTLIGYVILLKGLSRLFLPSKLSLKIALACTSKEGFLITMTFLIASGVILFVNGMIASI